mmetsp:Transcript_1395/g.2487  ORF Transcript_1395/g.2487 Transcript_1395/m.2487 type:complete len:214 (-) Transcript_1395:1333-1974(-)
MEHYLPLEADRTRKSSIALDKENPAHILVLTRRRSLRNLIFFETHRNNNNNNNNNDHNDNTRIKNNPRRPLKILFLSADTGGGHRASAEALAIQFQNLHPRTTYNLFDIWSDAPTYWPYSTLTETYTSASATPWKWRALYHVTNKELNQRFYNAHSCLMNEGLVRSRMVELGLDRPDCVVSVHPTMNYLPLRSIRKISEELDRHIPFFTVVTE